jgi:hypothetical protein
MTLIALTAIASLASALYAYGLLHWVRDTKGKRTTRSVAENQADENCARNTRISLVSGELEENLAAFRQGHWGRPAWPCGCTVAGLVATSANGICTNRS